MRTEMSADDTSIPTATPDLAGLYASNAARVRGTSVAGSGGLIRSSMTRVRRHGRGSSPLGIASAVKRRWPGW